MQCIPQMGMASHAVQEVLCITWFKVKFFQDDFEGSFSALIDDQNLKSNPMGYTLGLVVQERLWHA